MNSAPNLSQGGAEAARLAHNQEVAGSIPAPATNSAAKGLAAEIAKWGNVKQRGASPWGAATAHRSLAAA